MAATISPNIQLNNLLVGFGMKRPPLMNPTHSLEVTLKEAEMKLNYKSLPIVMGKFTAIKLTLGDQWVMEANRLICLIA